MTVAAFPSVVIYQEDGASTSFPVPFRYGDAANLIVERIAGAAVVPLAMPADYSATTGDTDAGGTLTLTITVSGTRLRIRRQTPRTQPMSYTTGDRFPAKSHEASQDRQMMVAQEIDAEMLDTAGRALLAPIGETGAVLPPRASRPGSFLAFDLNGNPVVASGTGADGGLRTDLAGDDGFALVGGLADHVASLIAFGPIDTQPTVVIGDTSQGPSLESGGPTVMLTRSNDLAFLQVSATGRNKTEPDGGFPDGATLRITGLGIVANGIQPQPLMLEPDTGLPADAYAALVGDTIAFYRPGRVPVTPDMLADNYFLRVTGIVAVLPETNA